MAGESLTGWGHGRDNFGLISTRLPPTLLPSHRYQLIRVTNSNCRSSLHEGSLVGTLRYMNDGYQGDKPLGTFLDLYRS